MENSVSACSVGSDARRTGFLDATTVFGGTQPPSYDVTADGHFVMILWADAQTVSRRTVLNISQTLDALSNR